MTVAKPVYLNVSSDGIFGPTIQGEGPYAGRLATFLRLSGCNLACSWCDTPYTWDWDRYDKKAETIRTPVNDIAERLSELPGRIVISGGEPLMQRHGLTQLLTHHLLKDRAIDVETNGTRDLGFTKGLWSGIIASPKVGPSAAQGTPPLSKDILEGATAFKFVVRDLADLNATVAFVNSQGIQRDRVWLMPEGIDAATLTERTPFVMEAAATHFFNFTTRLHTYGWGAERGH